jgi:WXXGXW repeat (2 copies)
MRTNHFVRYSLIVLMMLAASAAAFAQIGISVSFGPPALPVYEQPVCPGDGYLWTPGYWAYDNDFGDYYWVPGTWVEAPEVGYLWTPGYWGWGGGGYEFHEGYWGPHVGFYGGINYGFGYFGVGFEGGRWDGEHFFYNRSVSNVNVVNIHNVYNTTVENRTENRVSYNGGEDGVSARATAEEDSAARERHVPPVAVQMQHVQAARSNPELRASANKGKPPIAATARPGELRGEGAVPARQAGGEYHAPAAANHVEAQSPHQDVPRPGNSAHASDLQRHQAAAAVDSGNAKQDQKYQQQQSKLIAKQNQDHQKLQQKQDQDHQRLAQKNASDAEKQQTEQKHQQQTQQLEEKHTQQQQHLQQRQPASRGQGKPR